MYCKFLNRLSHVSTGIGSSKETQAGISDGQQSTVPQLRLMLHFNSETIEQATTSVGGIDLLRFSATIDLMN